MTRLFPTALAAAAAIALIPTGAALAAAQPTPNVAVDLCLDVDAAIDAGDTRLVDLDTDLRARITAALDATDDLTDTTALAAVRVELGCTDQPGPTTPAPTPEPTAEPTGEPEPTTPAPEPTTTTPDTTDSPTDTGSDVDTGSYSQLDDVPTGAAETGGGPA
ncbi:hypothetical protein DMP17_22260 [Pseudonocardia sp. TMWB2A]|uniref:hypothetical protein n=1 Tax=Pseudonocardia sp. TMWB2A TaxID=687430 RepID=UPI00307CED2E